LHNELLFSCLLLKYGLLGASRCHMSDIKKEKIEVKNLSLGMFVTELDIPWIESPFMLQGFVLDDQADLDKMTSLCRFVYIDRTKSIGPHFSAAAKQNVAIKREGAVVRAKAPKMPVPNSIKKAQQGEKISFIDIMRDLKNQKKPEGAHHTSDEGVIFNLRHGADTAAQATMAFDSATKKSDESITKKLIGDIGGFVGNLFKRERLKSTLDDDAQDLKMTHLGDDRYTVTIYEQDPPVENEIFNAIANEQEVDITGVSEVLDSMVESIGRAPDALMWLAKLKQTDDQAYNHALNVSITLMAFANFLALSKKQIKDLGLAGLLQDIGKVKLSSDIMLKKGKLTKEEYEYAKMHVEESLKILEKTPDISSEVDELVAQHHERVDGSGYPKQLQDVQLSIPSQAAGLIDTYCAITSHKTYAKGVYHQQALEEIHRLSGKQFNEQLVDQLVQFMGMYPVSSLVELNTGEVAVVVQQNQVRRLLPRLMLLLDPTKKRYESPVMLNLLNAPTTPSGELYRITRSLSPDSYGLNPSDFFL
jgi:HD-GYP domain-containing protein (c-di-GMP phosphodiesterase class II)